MTIADDLDEFLRDRVRSGNFRDQSDVINRAIQDMREFQSIDEKIARGVAQAERHEFVEQSFDQIVAEARGEFPKV